MGLYEGIKDVAKVVQQADNIELYVSDAFPNVFYESC